MSRTPPTYAQAAPSNHEVQTKFQQFVLHHEHSFVSPAHLPQVLRLEVKQTYQQFKVEIQRYLTKCSAIFAVIPPKLNQPMSGEDITSFNHSSMLAQAILSMLLHLNGFVALASKQFAKHLHCRTHQSAAQKKILSLGVEVQQLKTDMVAANIKVNDSLQQINALTLLLVAQQQITKDAIAKSAHALVYARIHQATKKFNVVKEQLTTQVVELTGRLKTLQPEVERLKQLLVSSQNKQYDQMAYIKKLEAQNGHLRSVIQRQGSQLTSIYHSFFPVAPLQSATYQVTLPSPSNALPNAYMHS